MSIWRKRRSHSTNSIMCSHKSEVYFHFMNTFRISVVRLCDKLKTENSNSSVIQETQFIPIIDSVTLQRV